MGRVRYGKSLGDLGSSQGSGGAKNRAGLKSTVRSIRCRYETDAEVAQAVVPKPLEASVYPEVLVSFSSVARQLTPDITEEIRSASFGVRVDYADRPGNYLLTMPMCSEAEVVGGRERFGEPRKLANIDFSLADSSVSASVERMGVTYLSALGNRVEQLAPRQETELAYCFKAFPSCEPSRGFDQDPQLVRLEWRHNYERVWRLEGGIELWDSPFDPVADLPVRNVLEFVYTEGTTEISGRALRPVPGEWLLPFMHQRYDEPQIEGVEV